MFSFASLVVLCSCNLHSYIGSIDWSSTIVGAIIGFILAIVYEKYIVSRKRSRQRNQYVDLTGTYNSEKGAHLNIKAEITYLHGDFLKISTSVKSSSDNKVLEIWEGEIKMETLNYGVAGIVFKEHHNSTSLETIDLKTFIFNRDKQSFTAFSYNKEDYPTPEHFVKF